MAGKVGMTSRKPVALPWRYERDFLWSLDRRSKLGRELQGNLAGLLDHLGGACEVSLPELYLCERVVFLEYQLRQHEAGCFDGGPVFTPNEYLTATNSLCGLLNRLGLRRRARDVMGLREYLSQAPDRPATPPAEATPERDP